MDKFSISTEIMDLNQGSSTVEIRIDPKSIQDAREKTRGYRALPERFRPALEEVADYVREEMIPRVFHAEGPGWAPLARRTQFERAQKGYGPQHPILKRTGDLYHSLTERSHPKHIEIIRVGRNSRVEIGSSAVEFIQNQTGRGDADQKLPVRAMIPGTGNIPLQDRDRAHIKEILAKAMKEQK